MGIRNVTLVLVDATGHVYGQIRAVTVSTPWLQEVAELVETANTRLGVDVSILRLLHTGPEDNNARSVTYLAQTAAAPDSDVEPWTGGLPDDPRRPDYARIGGPARALAWAASELGATVREVRQVRTWNLSAIWRIRTDNGTFWLKCVPGFFAHEGAVIELLVGTEPVPQLVARCAGRILMRDIPGEDLWGASLPRLKAMVCALVDLQWRSRQQLPALLQAGVPDFRGTLLTRPLTEVIHRHATTLGQSERSQLARFAEQLPATLAQLADCGLPDTLVHADFHPGNWRGDASRACLMDWGDCLVGHPLLDLPGLVDRVAPELQDALIKHWQQQWRQRVPGADVERACALVWPLATVRMAAVYAMFLDNIEVSERVYHAADPADCLRLAATRLGDDG